MKNKKLFFISCLFLISAPLSFTNAACSWETLTTNTTYTMGSSVTTSFGGCDTNNQMRSNDGFCLATTKPDFNLSSNDSAVCCCPKVETITEKEPIFTIPVPEVKIPTVELSKVDCVADDTGKYNCAIPWIGEYINGIYQYGINIVGILAAIMLMAGGLLWLMSGGDASKITQAKDIIIGSVTGLVILMASYIILTQVNPELVKMKSINTGYIVKDITPPPINTGEFAAKCKATDTGACAVSNMAIFGNRASQASAICMAESGGNASVFNSLTKCTGGEYAVWGLFQFNLSANKFVDEKNNTLDCPKAFNKVWKNSSPTCTVINKTLYDACVKAATNPELSIKNAYALAANGWGPWEANSKWCGF
ncbi:MAG: hypothetical protein ACYC40_04410 [Patescibacteria group bacterium]